MLEKSRSKAILKVKYLVLVPLMLVMLTYVACSKDEEINEVVEENIEAVKTVDNHEVIEVVEGEEEVIEVIGDLEVIQVVEEEVIEQFRINSEGSVEALGVSPHATLMEEARRVVKNLPKMVQGKYNEENVPISFKVSE